MSMSQNTDQDSPAIIREPTEWVRTWVPDSHLSQLNKPRVLLIGDSIVMGYGPKTSELIGEAVSLAWIGTSRFPADPAFFDEISLVLRHTRFDAVHFNNGLHGFGYEETQYAEHLKRIARQLRDATPEAIWMLANSTPLRDPNNLEQYAERNERVLVRNQTMASLAEELNLPMTDLYHAMAEHPEFYCPDGTHFNETGIAEQADHVAAMIRQQVLAK